MKMLFYPLLVMFWILSSAGWACAAPDSTRQVVNQIVETLKLEQQGLKQGSAWEREQATLVDAIRKVELEEAWYATQERIFTGYVESARTRIAELERKQANLARIEAELEGELITTVDAMARQLETSLPFLLDERRQRLHFLQRTVADYELDSAEKLRRVLDGLQAELSYGRDVELSEARVTIAGQDYLVRLLRLGRVGLYALGTDGSKAWLWHSEGGYQELDEAARISLQQALAMLDSQNLAALPVLPVSVQKR